MTSLAVPSGIDADALIARARALGAAVSLGFGAVAANLVRLDHTGQRATAEAVRANLTAFGTALAQFGFRTDLAAAAQAVDDTYAA